MVVLACFVDSLLTRMNLQTIRIKKKKMKMTKNNNNNKAHLLLLYDQVSFVDAPWTRHRRQEDDEDADDVQARVGSQDEKSNDDSDSEKEQQEEMSSLLRGFFRGCSMDSSSGDDDNDDVEPMAQRGGGAASASSAPDNDNRPNSPVPVQADTMTASTFCSPPSSPPPTTEKAQENQRSDNDTEVEDVDGNYRPIMTSFEEQCRANQRRGRPPTKEINSPVKLKDRMQMFRAKGSSNCITEVAAC